MGFADFFKKKKKEDLEVPDAPPTSEELPEYPASQKKVQAKEIKVEPQAAASVEKEEDYAVKLQKQELGERDDLELHKPIFVDLQLYKDMVDEVGLVKNIMKENEDTLTRVAEFKQDEDTEFKKWQSEMIDIQRKLIFADKTLFGMRK